MLGGNTYNEAFSKRRFAEFNIGDSFDFYQLRWNWRQIGPRDKKLGEITQREMPEKIKDLTTMFA